MNALPNWNVGDLYQNNQELAEKKEFIKEKAAIFKEKYLGKITNLSLSELLTATKAYEEISQNLGEMNAYGFLGYATDVTNEEKAIFYQNNSNEIREIYKDLVFFALELNQIEDEKFKIILQDSALKHYQYFYVVARKYKPHQLTEEMERFNLDKNMTAAKAWVDFYDQMKSDFVFNFRGKTMNEAELLSVMSNSTDSGERKEAGEIFGQKLKENIKAFTSIYNNIIKASAIESNWRNFKKPISSRNLENMIDDEVVESLMSSVKNHYESISHRYYKLKAKILGKEILEYTDRNAPIFTEVKDKEYSYGEAKDLILKAFAEFSPTISNITKEFFEKNWIDAEVKQGKMSGAFCYSPSPRTHPFVLVSFQGKADDVSTLAHELGHGVHGVLAQENSYLLYDTPLTIAETASIFAENIVFEDLYKQVTDNKYKAKLLAGKIEDYINSIIRQIAFCEFEIRLHNAQREEGILATEKINEIWHETQTASLGAGVKFEDIHKFYWSYVSHFIHTPFYVYSYGFGNLLVNNLFYLYKTNKIDNFEQKYLELLKAGGSKDYKELLSSFGLNAASSDFWNNGLKLITEYIEQLERLI